MNKSSFKVLNGIVVLVGFIVIGSILIWSPVCEKMIELANGNMTHMRCFYTGQASVLLSIVLIVAGIESLLMNTRKPWTFMAIGIMLLVVTSNSVLGIGICMKDTMPCHGTAAWIRGGGILTIIYGLVSLVKGDTRQ